MSKKFIYETLLPRKENYFYPLNNNNLSKKDLNAAIRVINLKELPWVIKQRILKRNLKKIKANYALMVNWAPQQIYYHYLHPVIQ